MALTVTNMSKKEQFQYSITPFDDRPTATAKAWPNVSKDNPVTGAITAYMVDRYQYNGRPAVTTYIKVDTKWYKTTSNHVAFMITNAHEAFGADLMQEITAVKLYKRPTERGDAAELEFVLSD